MSRSRLALAVLLAALAPAASAQVNVTFRFIPDLTEGPVSPVVRAFVPGSFNGWGQPYRPDTPGCIQGGHESQMTADAALAEYRKTAALIVGQTYAYKVQYQQTEAGTACTWIADPLNAEATDGDGNSLVQITDPMVFQIAREQDGTGEVRAVSAGVFGTAAVASVQFTVNGATYTTGITDTGSGVYRLALPAPVAPGAFVRVTATDAAGRTASAEVGTLAPDVTDRPVPAGLEDGITTDPADASRAWLVLRAPGKQFVYALGAFNGWTADGDALMFRDDADPLGTRWWIELTGLTPGAEVPFYYWVDGQIRVADPYTTKVVYPGEAGYPAGAGQHAVGVLTPGAPAFPWTDAAFQAPAQEDLVIYELLLRDFVADHSFTALADTLDYLERLGVNAIELMPVAEFDGDESWGYNPAFHLALDKSYGTPDDLKAFVDAAHARGMAVILDVVYNHATGQSPLVRLYNTDGAFGPPTADNPWANPAATHPFNVFNDLDHTNPLTQLWLDKANRFWVDEYHVDGYRYDLTGGFYQTGEYFEYNPQRITVLERMMGALWQAHPETVVILEHLVENGQEWRELAAYRGADGARPGPVLWHHMNREYSQGTMGYPTATDFPSALTETWTPNWAGGVPVPNAVTYMESHDEQWLMYRTTTYGNALGDYDTRDLSTALDRQRLAGVFFLTVPGPRMLWQFGELGYGAGPGECLVNGDYPGECPPGTPGRVDKKPIRWDYWSAAAPPFANGFGGTLTAADAGERAQRQDVYETWAALLDLRQSYALFRSVDTEVETRLGLTADRWIKLSLPTAASGQPTEAVIVGNFGVAETTVTPGFPATGTWYEYFSDTELAVADAGTVLTLRPGEYRIYTDVDVPSPDGDLGAVAGEDAPGDGRPEGLVSVFPNPTAGGATVQVSLAQAQELRVEAFDTLGRRVATLADGLYAPGTHSLAFNTAGLPAGVYVVRHARQSLRVTVAR